MASDFRLERTDGVATVTFDRAGSAVNSLSAEVLEEFEALLDTLESLTDLTGVVLLSGKPGSFIAGADLQELRRLGSEQEAWQLVRRGQLVVDRWHRLPVPTLAAIRGAALGGGLEIALASTFRLGVDERGTVLGLPEVRLGLLPALGGTYRLPRQVGLTTALDLLLSGRQLNARQALGIGLLDGLAAADGLAGDADRWLRQRSKGAPPRRGPWWVRNPLGRRVVLAGARRRVLERTAGHYPAPPAILEAVETGYRRGEAAALEREARSFASLTQSPVAAALVGLFLDSRTLSADGTGAARGGGRLRLGIVGAGFMGSAIATVALRAGHPVDLVDNRSSALDRVRAECEDRFGKLRRRDSVSREEAEAALERLSTATEIDALGAADLVVEAVSEDLEVKRKVLERIEAEVPSTAIIGSNTSTLPIGRLAEGRRRPLRILGLHFFSPVHRMPLVEIIRHPGSSREAVERAVEFVRGLGKIPIVVNDGPGFYTSRILSPYLAQGALMLQEGVPIAAIDAAARQVGFPVGPLELLDEVGLDVAAQAARILAEAFPRQAVSIPEFDRMVTAGRLGRKSGRGFYRYDGRRKRPDRSVRREVFGRTGPGPDSDSDELGQRMLLAMTAEAVRCLQDGVLPSPRIGDVAAVLGLGFPPFLGGPFRYLDDLGAEVARGRLERLEERLGGPFACPDRLRRMAADGGRFHAER